MQLHVREDDRDDDIGERLVELGLNARTGHHQVATHRGPPELAVLRIEELREHLVELSGREAVLEGLARFVVRDLVVTELPIVSDAVRLLVKGREPVRQPAVAESDSNVQIGALRQTAGEHGQDGGFRVSQSVSSLRWRNGEQ